MRLPPCAPLPAAIAPLAVIPLICAAGWVTPLPGSSVDAGFTPAEAYGSGHRGVDLRAEPGTPIRAVADGTVTLAGPVAGKPVLVLLVDDPVLGMVRVTHEPVLPGVEPGARVLAGQWIGTLSAAGGHCGRTPHCLHLGIKKNGRYLDPAAVIDSGQVVLKPRHVEFGARP